MAGHKGRSKGNPACKVYSHPDFIEFFWGSAEDFPDSLSEEDASRLGSGAEPLESLIVDEELP